MKRRKKRNNNNSTKRVIIVLIIAVLILGVMFLTKFLKGEKDVVNNIVDKPEKKEEIIVKKLQIVDEDSKSRPYAVMINNNHSAWPQCGIQDAYLVYEIIAEGGITRMMAL